VVCIVGGIVDVPTHASTVVVLVGSRHPSGSPRQSCAHRESRHRGGGARSGTHRRSVWHRAMGLADALLAALDDQALELDTAS